MMDFVLEAWVSSLIEISRLQWMFGGGAPWRPGEKLRLLFAGYNGTRNTGSDVRVEEMLRQVRRVLGPENVALSVMTQNLDRTRGYFGDARQVHLPDIFPPFLYREVRQQHGVVACEGSMFKSKFANALTTMMIGSLGIAAAQNKLSVGYGAEAGEMDRLLAIHVPALLRRLADHHAQHGIAHAAHRTGGSHRARNRHRLDLRAARPRIRPEGAARHGLGRRPGPCWSSAPSIPSGGR